MKARVYFNKSDCADPYTIFFPYPKKLQRTEHGHYVKGSFLTCNIKHDFNGNVNTNTFRMYGWQELDITLGYRESDIYYMCGTISHTEETYAPQSEKE